MLADNAVIVGIYLLTSSSSSKNLLIIIVFPVPVLPKNINGQSCRTRDLSKP